MFKRLVCSGLIAISLFSFVGCSKTEIITENVVAVVGDKEYVPSSSYTVMVHIGKSVMPQTRTKPAKYLLDIKYNDITTQLNDEEIFSLFEIGDEINCTLVKELNKNQEIKSQYLKIGWELENTSN